MRFSSEFCTRCPDNQTGVKANGSRQSSVVHSRVDGVPSRTRFANIARHRMALAAIDLDASSFRAI
jgi:hypothetical protein